PLTMHTLLILLIPIPHPPRPTLFPYTTLFRSDTEAVENTEVNGAYASSELDSGAQMEPSAPNDAPDVNVAVAMYARPPCWITNPDRKSTRLNSSHLVISYAVFCLKKKKNTHQNLPKPFPKPSSSLPPTVSICHLRAVTPALAPSAHFRYSHPMTLLGSTISYHTS